MNIEKSINSTGRDVFSRLKQYSSSPLSFSFWNKQILNKSSQYPLFKDGLFQLIGKLPKLSTTDKIIDELNTCLGDSSITPHQLINWLSTPRPSSLRGVLTALILKAGIRQMAKNFIVASTPENATKVLKSLRSQRLAFTADLLGEYSTDESSSDLYSSNFLSAMEVLSKTFPDSTTQSIMPNHTGELRKACFSIKLTALYHRLQDTEFNHSVDVLSEKLTKIALVAKQKNLSLYVDTEDSKNNPVIVATFKKVFSQQSLIDYPYPGIVVQAYAKKSEGSLQHWIDYGKARGCPISIRLVKGAYWDTETQLAKQQGVPSPVYAFKQSTDANYEHLTTMLLDDREFCYPAFASHNIRSLVHATCYADLLNISPNEFELQMLYGMADPIAKTFRDLGYLSRLYSPVGELVPGVGYLVRRLLENSSNESFLKHAFIDEVDTTELLQKPEIHNQDV